MWLKIEPMCRFEATVMWLKDTHVSTWHEGQGMLGLLRQWVGGWGGWGGGGYWRNPKRYSKTIRERKKAPVITSTFHRVCGRTSEGDDVDLATGVLRTRDCVRQLQVILVSRLLFCFFFFSFSFCIQSNSLVRLYPMQRRHAGSVGAKESAHKDG